MEHEGEEMLGEDGEHLTQELTKEEEEEYRLSLSLSRARALLL